MWIAVFFLPLQVGRGGCPCVAMETGCRFCLYMLPPPPPPPFPPPRDLIFTASPSAVPAVRWKWAELLFLMLVVSVSCIVMVTIFSICFKVKMRKSLRKEENSTSTS